MAHTGSGGTAADALKSAAIDIRRDAGTVRESRALLGERLSPHRSEYCALIRWAEQHRKLLSFSYIEQYKYVSAGAEHRVYSDSVNNLAIKATLPNKFGHSVYGPGCTATPVEYFERLAWQNAIFGDGIRVIGVSYEEDQLEIVTSQPWIKAHSIRPIPFPEEIDAYLLRFGFHRVPFAVDAPLFYSAELGLVVADAHDQNILRDQEGKFAAIDVVVGYPGPELLREITRAFASSG